ncbi:MAG: WecB/TagA/CpsF family glycosyltransferase [Candidatus Levybacteria bacterium]|nr:WecB/TagA/CpsF family glycosyltransferase [Candidatus Levybacteria bacterium]MBI2420552.1 WecB/TagA/CpsF family glycosyltransferase [Candidatus Levybacteria bacterium]
MEEINKKKLLGIKLSDVSLEKVLKFIYTSLQNNTKKYYVITPNTEIFMLAKKNPAYKKIINEAKLALPDSVGITWAGKMLGVPLRERVPGVELLENLCKEVAGKPITVGFFGGRQNVALRSAERLTQKYPGLKVAFAVEEWPLESGAEVADENFLGHAPLARLGPHVPSRLRLPSSENFASSPRPKIINLPCRQAGHQSLSCDILFVALGSPKQEIWIAENLAKIDVKVAIGVGGAFDFISGEVRRAPVWIRKIGLEWLFRLMIQPWRWKRQLSLISFVILVIKERLFDR